LKECLRHDRARIQVGHISHFGLLEMSRQRIRSSVLESSTEKCSHCGGSGHVRSVSSVTLQLLRAIEEILLKGATHNLTVRTRSDIALYMLNQKRAHLRALEERFRIAIMVNADASVGGQLSFVIEKGDQVHSLEQAKALALQPPAAAAPIEEEEEEEYDDEEESESEDAAVSASEEEAHGATEAGTGRKRKRRRRGRRGGEGREPFPPEREAFAQEADFAPVAGEHEAGRSDEALHAAGAELERPAEPQGEGERRRRRRGRRGGRRNRRGREEGFPPETAVEPTPADDAAESAGEVRLAAAGESEPESAAAGESEPESAAAGASESEALAAPIVEAHSDAVPTHEPEPIHQAQPEDARSPQIAAPATPEASEPPRRRSTVREPAPQAWGDDAALPPPTFTGPAPTIEPVVTSSAASEDSDRPRRSGWWSRRVLGKS
jgi:ribonuclease E